MMALARKLPPFSVVSGASSPNNDAFRPGTHGTLSCHLLSAANRVFQAAMALAPLYAGACRTGFVILTAKPIAGHAQRASGGNAGQDEIAAAGALDVDPGRRQAPALDHRRASHPGRRPCRRTPQQSRPPLCSSRRLPETSVSLPGITLSDKGGQGERAHCRRSVWVWRCIAPYIGARRTGCSDRSSIRRNLGCTILRGQATPATAALARACARFASVDLRAFGCRCASFAGALTGCSGI